MKEYVAVKNLNELKEGDVVKGTFGDEVYIVTANYGDRVTAVSTVDITNPPEWLVLRDKQ